MSDVLSEVSVFDIMSAEKGSKFSVVVLIKSVEIKTAKNNTEYLVVTVTDRTGSCICKVFGSSPLYNFFKSVKAGTIILLEGVCGEYKGAFSPEVTFARVLTEEEIKQGGWVEKTTVCANEGLDALTRELYQMVNSINDETLRAIVQDVIEEVRGEFYEKAAGIAMHHAYKNGLLEHTVHAARAGVQLLQLYKFVDYDLALSGLLLHDIGKILEYTGGENVQRTKLGILQGHLVLGYRMVRKAAIQHKLDEDRMERLEHILLSHHSDPEFGAVVRPATPEAVFVALVDNLDAKMGMVEQLLGSTPAKNVFSDFHKGLESKLLVSPIGCEMPEEV